MAFAERDGNKIFYEVRGAADRPILLLIMGMGFSSKTWATLPARLEDRFRVVVFDHRGTGESSRPRGLFTMADMADDAAAVLEALGARDKGEPGGGAFVFGISMGGMVAQELVLRHGNLVKAVVFGATHAGYWSSDKPDVTTMTDMFRVILSPKGNTGRMARLLLSHAYVAASMKSMKKWIKTAPPASSKTAVLQMLAIARHDTAARLRGLDIPTLVISGDEDRLIPIENSRALAALVPGARLIELRGVGHVFPVEQEDATVEALVGHFLPAAL